MATETYNHDDITSGSDEIATTSVTIASGQNLAQYTPIGQVSTSGKFIECDPTATNGSQTPVYLTALAVDATAGDVKTQVIKAGTYDPQMVNWNENFDATKKLLAFVGTPISLQEKAPEL